VPSTVLNWATSPLKQPPSAAQRIV
jgi:hypothetical protein